MSSISFQASAVLPLGLSEPACDLLHSARPNHIAGASSLAIGLASPSTTTCEPSPPIAFGQMEFPSMPSPAASPAKTSAMQDLERAWLENDLGCSTNTPDSLASLDRTSRSWRTSQRCLIEGWQTFSERFPTSG